MKTTFFTFLYIFPLLVLCGSSCQKYLEQKPDQRLATPDALEDVQAILDNVNTMNEALKLSNNSTDEYYLRFSDWQQSYELDKDSYIWAPETNLRYLDDWNIQYRIIFYANTALDNLDRIGAGGRQARWNALRGAALFFRAYAFSQLLLLYGDQYDPATAATDWGIPLRLTADFNDPTVRSTVQAGYDQLIGDVREALPLFDPAVLPVTPATKTRPGKTACHALLARIYLQMGDYPKAQAQADSCLQQYSTLLTYELLDGQASNPFVRFNSEVIFYTNTQNALNTFYWMAWVDTTLYQSYASQDLRKTLFFQPDGNGDHYFKGSYNGSSSNLFNGLATDEVYLVRAEAKVRNGDSEGALADLNTLLRTRWRAADFTARTETDPQALLDLIIAERRKELLNRGTRWWDLKRLNKDPQRRTTLVRSLNGQTYTLSPNDLRYTLLIPERIIELSGIPQNKR